MFPGHQSKQSSMSMARRKLAELEAELTERRTSFGETSIEVADTLATIGLLHQYMRRDEATALDYHNQALRILCDLLERQQDESTDFRITSAMASTLTDVAFILERTGRYIDASEKFKEVRRLLDGRVSSSDPRLGAAVAGMDRLSRLCSSRRSIGDESSRNRAGAAPLGVTAP